MYTITLAKFEYTRTTFGFSSIAYVVKYDNFLLLGYFNSEMSECIMDEFCETYNLTNLVTGPTCFKNPINPSLIVLIFRNMARRFQDSCVIETGLSHHHKLTTITVLREHFLKLPPFMIRYRDYKKFDQIHFRNELFEKLSKINKGNLYSDMFEDIYIAPLDKHVLLKRNISGRIIRTTLPTRSRLRNKFLKNPNNLNRTNHTKYRDYCTRLFKKEKRDFYNNLDPKLISANRKFWKTIYPLFSEKHFSSNNITLLEGNEIVFKESDVAKTLNLFFSLSPLYRD